MRRRGEWRSGMRAVIQRVSRASVTVEGEVVGGIGHGWAIRLGVGSRDDESAANRLVDTLVKLRAFEDEGGKMNRSALDVGAEVLVVSQFTLYADLSRGRRPSFTSAAPPEQAERLVERVVSLLRAQGLKVATGRFGALMEVDILNHGPVTFFLST